MSSNQPASPPGRHFADDLARRLRQLGHPLCAGLDPHLERIPPLFRQGSMSPYDPASAAAVESFLRAFLDRLAGRVAVVKPQAAFFEQLGSPGVAVLERPALSRGRGDPGRRDLGAGDRRRRRPRRRRNRPTAGSGVT